MTDSVTQTYRRFCAQIFGNKFWGLNQKSKNNVFNRVPHGEVTAKNGSIPSRNKKEQFEVCPWQTDRQSDKPVGEMVRSLASMSLCKYRSSAHLLKLTRTSVKLTGKLVCYVARLVSIMIISDDVISDVIRPRSTIREDHIDTPYREILC